MDDDGGLNAPGVTHLPMGPEQVWAAGGTEAADVDVLRENARAQQPLAVQSRQVHMVFGGLPGKPRASRMASATSLSVSKQHGPIQGPMAARMFSGLAPYSAAIAATAFSTMPPAQPRHPAWTPPTAPVTGSWRSRMPQSAEKTVSGRFGSLVMRASAV